MLATLIAAVAAPFAKDWVSSEAHKIKDLAGDNLYKAGSALTRSIRAGYDTANKSLVSYGKPGRIEPLCFIDAATVNSPMLSDVAQVTLAQYSGHYLRAVTLDNASIAGVSVSQRLAKFATHRDVDYLAAVGIEGLTDHLPFPPKQLPAEYAGVALEAMTINPNRGGGAKTQAQLDNEAEQRTNAGMYGVNKFLGAETPGNSTARADTKNFDAQSNLAIGKMLNVTVTSDGHSITVPVIVRMNIMTIPTDTLTHIYTSAARDISLPARWKEFWNGRIDFWKDLVYTSDLIDAHANQLKNDKTGFYRMMIDRRNNNMTSAMLSGVPAVNTSSAVLILNSQTAAHIGAYFGGDLADYATRQKFFKTSYSMIIAVIDDRFGTTRFYTRDINEWTELRAQELKQSSKGNGPDVGDILAAYRVGNSPTL